MVLLVFPISRAHHDLDPELDVAMWAFKFPNTSEAKSGRVWGGQVRHIFYDTLSTGRAGEHVFYHIFHRPGTGEHAFYHILRTGWAGEHVFYHTF